MKIFSRKNVIKIKNRWIFAILLVVVMIMSAPSAAYAEDSAMTSNETIETQTNEVALSDQISIRENTFTESFEVTDEPYASMSDSDWAADKSSEVNASEALKCTSVSQEISTMERLKISRVTREAANKDYQGDMWRLAMRSGVKQKETLQQVGFQMNQIDPESKGIAGAKVISYVRSSGNPKAGNLTIEVAKACERPDQAEWIQVTAAKTETKTNDYKVVEYTVTLDETIENAYQWLRISFSQEDQENWTTVIGSVDINYFTEDNPEEGFSEFITRRGNKLYLGNSDEVFKSIVGASTSLFHCKDSGEFRFLTEEEVRDAFLSTVQMGGKWSRTYTIPVGTGDWCYIQGCASNDGVPEDSEEFINYDAFNEEAFAYMDMVVAVAQECGVRLVIPFTDYQQHVGGPQQYMDFRGASGGREGFWTNEDCQRDFKAVIKYILNRTNTITGVKYKDNPTILAWETGNEMGASGGQDLENYLAWDRIMSAYIKSQDENHLVASGSYIRQHGVQDSVLWDENVDIIDPHYYGYHGSETFTKTFQSHLARVKENPDKVMMIGEFGIEEAEKIKVMLDTVLEEDCIMGAQLWSLRIHTRDGGYYSHREAEWAGRWWYSHTWPGNAAENYDSTTGTGFDTNPKLVDLTRDYAYAVMGVETPPVPLPTKPRILDYATPNNLRFFGSTGATHYIIQRSDSEDGPWDTLTDNYDEYGTPYDYQAVKAYEPFQDTTAKAGESYYYRVIGVNDSGQSEPSDVVLLTVPNVYTVQFDSQGGSESESVLVEEGTVISVPEAPMMRNKWFTGWYTDASCKTRWNFEQDIVNDNITLYAGWSETGTLIDTFEEDNVDQWTVMSGSWAVEESESNHIYHAGKPGLIYAGDEEWTDYSIETKVKALQLGNNTSISLSMRYVDNDNRYTFGYSQGFLAINKKVEGKNTTLAKTEFQINTGQEYVFKAVVNGNQLELYVNGVLYVTAEDDSFTQGKIALATYDCDAVFDDVFVITGKETDENDSSDPTDNGSQTPGEETDKNDSSASTDIGNQKPGEKMDKNDSSVSTHGGSPKTGDETEIYLPSLLMILSVMIVGVFFIHRRKKR